MLQCMIHVVLVKYLVLYNGELLLFAGNDKKIQSEDIIHSKKSENDLIRPQDLIHPHFSLIRNVWNKLNGFRFLEGNIKSP